MSTPAGIRVVSLERVEGDGNLLAYPDGLPDLRAELRLLAVIRGFAVRPALFLPLGSLLARVRVCVRRLAMRLFRRSRLAMRLLLVAVLRRVRLETLASVD